jgi:choline dehydrogenase-like flavoprotein
VRTFHLAEMRLSNFWIFLALAVDAAPTPPGPSYGSRETSRREYDYIVVGAGASGLTVANRLSEHANTSVLVIEAGLFNDDEDFFTIPGLAGGAIGTKYDWNLTYTKSVSLNGREVSIPAGKVVGGSTQLNRMVFDRGSKSDYDRWSSLGNKGWDWESLLPYFKKVGVNMQESMRPCANDTESRMRYSRRQLRTLSPNTMSPTTRNSMDRQATYTRHMHHSFGLQPVCSPSIFDVNSLTFTLEYMINATRELGIETSYDQASGFALGGYFCPHNQNPADETRSSAKEAYYDTARNRSNLEIITGQRVTRILTTNRSGCPTATGVEVGPLLKDPA